MIVSFIDPDGPFLKFIPPHRSKRTSTGAGDFSTIGFFGHIEISRINEAKNKNARKVEELTNQTVTKDAEISRLNEAKNEYARKVILSF